MSRLIASRPNWVRRAFVVAVLAFVGASMALPSSASATANGVMVGIFPDFPTRVELGATDMPASVNLINGSIGEEAKGPLTVTEVLLVPSCGNFTPTCAGAADPGVFQLSAKGAGAPGTNCANRSFDITPVDPVTGQVRFTYSDGSPIVLAATDMTTELDTCRIRFTISSKKLPAIDSYLKLADLQTNQVGFMSVRHGNGSAGTDQGEDVTTITGGTPATTTTTVPATTTSVPATTTTVPATTTTTAPTATTTTTAPPATTTTTTRVLDPRNVRWVDRVFRDFLGRSPTKAESEHWAGTLDGGMHTRGNAAKAITTSTEFWRLTVNRYFTSHLSRLPSGKEMDAQLDLLSRGSTLQSIEAGILASNEFYVQQGSPEAFVESLFRRVLLTPPDSTAATLVDDLKAGAPRASVALRFTAHPVVHDSLAKAATYWLLRRAPDPTELAAWSDSLDAGVRQEHFFAYLACSDEYWRKAQAS